VLAEALSYEDGLNHQMTTTPDRGYWRGAEAPSPAQMVGYWRSPSA
jgi:hypothetical protein